jgi:hypothetical protein
MSHRVHNWHVVRSHFHLAQYLQRSLSFWFACAFSFLPVSAQAQSSSAPHGGWEAALHLDRWRNRDLTFDGDTLYFWCFSQEPIPAARLPRIQLRDGEGSFTAPLGLERVTETIPARQ